jgi:hypothetical protein
VIGRRSRRDVERFGDMKEGNERTQATHGENYDRLAAVKATFDRPNLVLVKQNLLTK